MDRETATRSLADLLSALGTSVAALPHAFQWGLGVGLVFVLGFVALSPWLALGRRRRDAIEARLARLTTETLETQQAHLLELASERFGALQTRATSEFENRHRAVEDLVSPLQQSLDRYQREMRDAERTRDDQAGRLGEQLRALADQTSELSGALRAPGARGRWGELSLRRTVELAGLSAHCDFREQPTLGSGAGSLRPDLIVDLPSGRRVVIDAKAPFDAYLKAHSAGSDSERDEALARHAKHVRRHVDTLAGRDYASHVDGSPEFVVLFLPHEGFLAAAIEKNPNLVADALSRGIVLATPATLFALLAAVAQGWREVQLSENTQQVLAIAREMDDRLGTFVDHFEKVGASIGRSIEHFNTAVGSFENRVLSQARRMRELGVQGSKSLDPPARVETARRSVSLREEPA